MKAKYLFFSLALASAFTACTQDEMFETPALESNEVAGRPVAGVVAFVNDEVDSRYDRQNAKFENGDKMGIYLMDEFRGGGEEDNANETLWNYQSTWWKMYNMVDYISTNYSYEYNADTKEWVNRASRLNEGNYIALFPQNEVATNRRDLWHPINANVNLVAHSDYDRYFVGRDNQFFVGYEQIKRDQNAEDSEGNLTAKISMKPIMTYGKLSFENQSDSEVKIKKVVFKSADGQPLPNVAYIKPSQIVVTEGEAQNIYTPSWISVLKTPTVVSADDFKAPVWAWKNLTAMSETSSKVNCKYQAQGTYDRETFAQADARAMVQYASTAGGQIPYGMTEEQAAPIYEYVFTFPGDGIILAGEGDSGKNKVCGISIALPTFDGWQNMKVVVHGEKWDQVANNYDGAWRPGVIIPRAVTNGDTNAEFNLNVLKEWNTSMTYLPEAVVRIDDNYFYQGEEVRTSTTQDLVNLLKARLTNPSTNLPVNIDVYPYGAGLEVTDEVVALLDEYEAKNGDITVTFNSANTPVILKAANSIHKFEYACNEVVLEADQNVEQNVNGITTLKNASQATLTVKAGKIANKVVNEGTMVVAETRTAAGCVAGEVNFIENWNALTLKAGSKVTTLKAYGNAKTEVYGVVDGHAHAVVVNELEQYNDINCAGCAGEPTLNIVNGTLKVATLTNNAGKINVATGAAIELTGAGLTNVSHKDYGVEKSIINNNGTIYNATSVSAAFKNTGIINNGDAEGAKGYIYNNGVYNYGIINIYGGEIHKLTNGEEGKLNVWSENGISVQTTSESDGTIVYKGVANGHIGDLYGDDTKAFEIQSTQAGIETKDLVDMMHASGAKEIWTKYNINLTSTDMPKTLLTWAKENISKLYIQDKNTVEIKGIVRNTTYGVFKNAEVEFETVYSELHIGGNITMLIKGFKNGRSQTHVESGSNLLSSVNNTRFENVLYH